MKKEDFHFSDLSNQQLPSAQDPPPQATQTINKKKDCHS